eukprot:TRINITY_DN30095_c0_g1_i1.p1 TRINITY_DN30095_c0_g1~~TRINITY_DN30095_c0_g1_i1.p1  ORF type:complete len:325 (+),score=46.87 TRINITY_DN30095_c0_g1_i1:74-976(+)
MDDIPIKEVVKDKVGVELFRELLRQLPLAVYEDYYRNGVWQDNLLRLDIQILDCHRREAGAPDPLPLSEVPVPEVAAPPKVLAMPKHTVVRPPVGVGQVLGGIRAPGPVVAAASALRPPASTPLAPVSSSPVGPANAAAANVAMLATGGTADLKQIGLFVTKWGLEPTRAKLLLARLHPTRRTFVMSNFQYAPVNGELPITKLEEYIAECEQSNAWLATPGKPATADISVTEQVKRSHEEACSGSNETVDGHPAKRLNNGSDIMAQSVGPSGAKGSPTQWPSGGPLRPGMIGSSVEGQKA